MKANILIDSTHKACLSDFGLTNITHDARTASLITTSTALHGSIRWMAPELLHPEHAGRDNGKSSAESDIYSFAMVMLEVGICFHPSVIYYFLTALKIFTGKIPFYQFERDATVVFNIVIGIRPERPPSSVSELGLTDELWELMGNCWQSKWRERPNITQILSVVEKCQSEFSSDCSESQTDEKNPERADESDSDSSDSADIDGPSFLNGKFCSYFIMVENEYIFVL